MSAMRVARQLRSLGMAAESPLLRSRATPNFTATTRRTYAMQSQEKFRSRSAVGVSSYRVFNEFS
jgi:hypothetical protein